MESNVLTIGRGSADATVTPLEASSRKAARAAARASKSAKREPRSGGTTASTAATSGRGSRSTPDGSAEAKNLVLPQADFYQSINAYSQQSRFHRETFDANTTDLDIKGVNITVGLKDILVDAHLRLKKGVRYGMVGQNGVGKSVLMKVLSDNLLVGLPQNVRFLHVKQLEEEIQPGRTEAITMKVPAESASSAKEARKQRLREVVAGILLTRSLTELDMARKIATKRSGQRGYIARQNLLDVEKRHWLLISRLKGEGLFEMAVARLQGNLALASNLNREVEGEENEEDGEKGELMTPRLIQRVLKDVFERYRSLASGEPLDGVDLDLATELGSATLEDGNPDFDIHLLLDTDLNTVESELEARARKVLKGIGFKDHEIGGVGESVGAGGKELSALSGGWKMRVALAKALFLQPHVLLLDEPTNHLDLPSILWLTHHFTSVADPDQTIVIVSHDKEFLNSVTEETIVFKDKKLVYFKGSFEEWEWSVEEKQKRFGRLKELEEKKKKHIAATIQKNVQQARATGDDKRLGMVASRKKALDRLGMQKLESGKRYKESYHGYRAEIKVEEGFKTLPISLPTPYEVPFHSSAILQLNDMSFQYGDPKKGSSLLLENISLDISPHARIAFLGPNGCGKSTLMNLLAGVLKPTKGEVRKHHRLRIGYFSQHTVDQLDLDKTPLEALRETYIASSEYTVASASASVAAEPGVITEQQARAHFAAVGITGGEPIALIHQKIRTLSGGQRNRVALGLVTFHQPHVLLLDEITNHLDIGSVESVVEALQGFEGAVVVVSHDVWFLREVVERGAMDDESDDEEGEDGNALKEGGIFYVVNSDAAPGGVVRWEEGLDAYVESVKRKAKKGWKTGG
ncbi:P-loop containing nucleoside triphosphate hydrolase protein [Coprinopsis sp. MPI-PUGE-AT-0042]|nr:P-loop containing nucleoside triphosphate hydrolase protein [Coprinopsis sp. MPI-PUGE-AT-0042]